MTSTDLVVIPHTGEAIALGDIARCAKAIEEIKLLKAKLAAAERQLADAVGQHTLVYGAKTMHLEGVKTIKVTGGPGSGEIQWDMDVLVELLEAGLPEERWNAMVTETVTTKVDAKIATQLEKANPKYAEIIQHARHRSDKPWSVTL